MTFKIKQLFRASCLVKLEYEYLLPVLSKLPPWISIPICNLRGLFNAYLERDWREIAQWSYVKQYTANAMRVIQPAYTNHQITKLVYERYKSAAREELEALWSWSGKSAYLQRSFVNDDFIECCRTANDAGQGVVLLTAHFASALLGVVFLGQAGLKVNVMSSAVNHDSRVPAPVQKHFYRKYRSKELWLNGGRFIDIQNGLRPFYRLLERGECLVVLGDLPPSQNGTKITIDFLEKKRILAGGAWRLAKETGSLFGSFVCFRQKDGKYCIDNAGPWASNHDASLSMCYDFLFRYICKYPEQWWACDLLPHFPVIDTCQISEDGVFFTNKS